LEDVRAGSSMSLAIEAMYRMEFVLVHIQ